MSRKRSKCMRCNGPFVGPEIIYCQKCIDRMHLEWIHPDTMQCDCDQKFGQKGELHGKR